MKAATNTVTNILLAALFQSTPPVKAATQPLKYLMIFKRISIHAAREGGDEVDATNLRAFLISIHAAREGGDQ